LNALLISSALALPLLAHDRITTKVTWEREIAPIVQARCVSCHSPGGRAPMPLTTYEEARPWAKAIKEEVLSRRMPKWHVVRGYGDFKNDPSLSAFEIALLAAWADGGAPAVARAPDTPPVRKLAAPSTADNRLDALPTRSIELPCTDPRLPTGRLVAIRPTLEKGESLRVTLVHAGGGEEPLLWVRAFDPAFQETYWLRNPSTITRATRMRAEAPASCTITALLAPGREK
jgi:hypothetical protein